MTESRDEWIKKRAYSLWEEEGYPTGRDQQHWEQAMKERAVMETTAPHGLAVKSKTKSAAAAKASPKKAPTVKVATLPKTEVAKADVAKPAVKSKAVPKTNGSVAPVVAAKSSAKKDVAAKL